MHKIGRNEPCRCGSGKKYKKCRMMKDKTGQNRERTASTQLQQWDVVGARPLQVPAGHWKLSGALYHFPRDQAEMLKQYLAECLEGVPEDQQTSIFSDILAYDWLTMMLNPQLRMPQIMDGVSGDPMSQERHGDRSDTALQPDIPDDVRQQLEHDYKRKYYAAWPDTALPALSGKTPREAVETAKGRDRVIRLLKDFENIEVGAEHPFDFGFLWQALGLDR